MPPTWVLIVAPTGVLFVVLLTWILGGRFSEPITAAWLERFLAGEEPPERAVASYIGVDGRAALVLLNRGRLGVVARVGDGLAFRHIDCEVRVERTAEKLRIRPPGLTFPAVTMRCSDQDLPASLRAALDSFTEG
ncbi:MAG: hypothetical protein AAF654_05045 [Myxococcota bacterium]